MKKWIHNLLVLICAAVMVFSAWKIFGIIRGYRESQDSYRELEQYVSFTNTEPVPQDGTEPVENPAVDPTEEGTAEPTEMPDVSAWPQVDFAQLAQINGDIVGWIYIPETVINYPVVQTTDNSYYLKRLFNGRRSGAGCIFLDYRSEADFSERNSIIYGHHMNDRTMFARLVDYKSQKFYEAHPIAYLVTPTAYFKIIFFSGYVSEATSNSWKLSFRGEEYSAWLEEIGERSCFTPHSVPTVEDRVITLSTCTYEYNDARFVLHGYIAEEIRKPVEPVE